MSWQERRIRTERYFFGFESMLELVKNSFVYAETYTIVNEIFVFIEAKISAGNIITNL